MLEGQDETKKKKVKRHKTKRNHISYEVYLQNKFISMEAFKNNIDVIKI